MSAVEQKTFFTDSAAEDIAELIEQEDEKVRSAQARHEEIKERVTAYREKVRSYEGRPKPKQGSEEENKRNREEHRHRKDLSKLSAAKRDEHRARTSLLAYKTALRIVLLERACREAGGAVAMPDPDEFLMNRRLKPPLV